MSRFGSLNTIPCCKEYRFSWQSSWLEIWDIKCTRWAWNILCQKESKLPEFNGVKSRRSRGQPSLKGLLLIQDALFAQKDTTVPVIYPLPLCSLSTLLHLYVFLIGTLHTKFRRFLGGTDVLLGGTDVLLGSTDKRFQRRKGKRMSLCFTSPSSIIPAAVVGSNLQLLSTLPTQALQPFLWAVRFW